MSDSILNLILNIRKAGKGDKEAVSGLDAMGKKIDSVLKNSKQNAQMLTHTVGAVGKLLGDAFKLAADEAQRLGRSEVTAQMKEMDAAFKTVTDTLVQIPIGGRDFLAWMGDAAEGAANAGKAIAALSIYIAKNTGAMTESEAATAANALMNSQAVLSAEQLARAQIDLADPMDETNQLLRAQADAAKYLADKESKELAAAMAEAAMKAGEFNAILGQAVDNELVAYQNKQKDLGAQIADTKGKLDELGKTPHLTAEQKTQLEELKTSYENLKTQYEDNAKAHNLAVREIMLGYLQQQMAMDGPLTEAEQRYILKVGEDWGVLKSGTVETWDAIAETVKTSMGDAEEFIKGMGNRLPGYFTDLNYDLTYNVRVNGQVPYGAEPGGEAPVIIPADNSNATFGGMQAAGGDYWVTRPTWFMAGEAGPERATFTPQGKENPMGGVTIGNVSINVDGAGNPQAVAQRVMTELARLTRSAINGGAAMVGAQ